MFTQAGFNARSARVTDIVARVAVRDGRRRGVARLVHFACGDLAWYSSNNFLIWGERAHIENFFYLPSDFFSSVNGFPSSSIDGRSTT